jgi:hypothetical protein
LAVARRRELIEGPRCIAQRYGADGLKRLTADWPELTEAVHELRTLIEVDGGERPDPRPTRRSLRCRSRARLMQKAVAPLANSRISEEQVLAELLQAAARSGVLDRFEVHGWSKPDIIEYLPVAEFIPDARNWSEAKRDWPREIPFKKWLASRGAKVHGKALAAICCTTRRAPE